MTTISNIFKATLLSMILGSFIFSNALATPKYLFTDESIISLIKTKSFSISEQNLKKLNIDSIQQTSLTPYKWNFNFDLSQENDRTDSLSTLTPINSEKTRALMTLSKKYSLGTSLQFDFANIDFKTQSTSSDYKSNALSFTIEQNLLPFFKTNVDQLALENSQLEYRRANLQWQSDQIASVRNILSNYWRIKALAISVKENSAVFKKYESLVATVRKKRANNFASPGELQQALAEYNSRAQQLQEDQISLAQEITDLKFELGLAKDAELEISPELAAITAPQKIDLKYDRSNPYLIQKYRTEIAKNSAQIANAKTSGQWSLYGKATPTGVDPSNSESFNEMSRFKKDKLLVGIKFQYTFEDFGSEKEAQYKRALEILESAKLEEMNLQLENQMEIQFQSLQSSFAAIKRNTEIVDNRVKALEALAQSYLQGRVDISNLIDAYSRMVTSKVNLYKAYGKYYDQWLSYSQLSAIESSTE